MANVLTTSFRNGILGAHATRIVMATDTIRGMFVDGADDVPTVADDFIDDIVSAGRIPAIASCPTLASKTVGTVATGVFDCGDITFSSLSGDQAEYFILFKHTGVESTSDIICIFDTATGLPVTPSGGDVVVVPSASGVFQI